MIVTTLRRAQRRSVRQSAPMQQAWQRARVPEICAAAARDAPRRSPRRRNAASKQSATSTKPLAIMRADDARVRVKIQYADPPPPPEGGVRRVERRH